MYIYMVKRKSIKKVGRKRSNKSIKKKCPKGHKVCKCVYKKRSKKKGGTRMMMPSGYFGKRHPRYQSKSKRCLKVKYL